MESKIKRAKHEAGHYIVMLYYMSKNGIYPKLEYVTIDPNYKIYGVNGSVKLTIKQLLYFILAGHATEKAQNLNPYQSLDTEEFIEELIFMYGEEDKSDLQYYIDVFDINKLSTYDLFDLPIDIKNELIQDFEHTVNLCKELESDIKEFAELLIRNNTIKGSLLTDFTEKYINKYKLKYASENQTQKESFYIIDLSNIITFSKN